MLVFQSFYYYRQLDYSNSQSKSSTRSASATVLLQCPIYPSTILILDQHQSRYTRLDQCPNTIPYTTSIVYIVLVLVRASRAHVHTNYTNTCIYTSGQGAHKVLDYSQITYKIKMQGPLKTFYTFADRFVTQTDKNLLCFLPNKSEYVDVVALNLQIIIYTRICTGSMVAWQHLVYCTTVPHYPSYQTRNLCLVFTRCMKRRALLASTGEQSRPTFPRLDLAH